jgi:large subunit ribosomal protein L25
MERIELKASPREIIGKKVKALRRQGQIPANIYGHDLESLPIQVESKTLLQTLVKTGGSTLVQLKIEGDQTARPVLVREVQYSPRTGNLLHVDFYQVRMTERMQAEVPVVLVGEAPASADFGGIILQNLNALMVECLPGDLPGQIEVDITRLDTLDTSIQVKDLALPEAVTVITDPETSVVNVAAPRVVEEVEEVELGEGAVEGVEGEEVEAPSAEQTPEEESEE